MAVHGAEEPSAATRQASAQTRQWFVGLVQAGFTEGQALIIIGHALGVAMGTAFGAAGADGE